MDVNKVRKDIDSIDVKILQLLNDRAEASRKIGKIKLKKGQGIYAPHREKEVLDHIKSINRGLLTSSAIEAIYREIMSSSISLEKEVRIAYLGPESTFTHQAAQKKFGASVTYFPCTNISDVFAEVERGRSDYGVVPVENSTEGAVNYTLDMFIESNLKICAELYLLINHNLLSNAASIKKINQIYSIPQALAQCRLWLESNIPSARLMPTSSTADAARYVAEHPQFKNEIACIASTLAAKEYRLRIFAPSIEDNANNTTRFIVIARTDAKPTGKDRTSIVFAVKDRVGALHDILLHFQKANINLTKIESRPSKKKIWSYFFFVDFEGHAEDPKIKQALNNLEKYCTLFKILGAYPKVDF
ncbi:MAG: chorismate mutase [Candidatus Omnitrophica bacterium CG1_02_49_16]|nr:MAG: chorismate mutase [Candidatus Omnitrophica bacterium CG1_02_49_16]